MEQGVPETTSDASTCSRCGGTGWVIEDDEGVGTARRCSCHKDHLGDQLRQRAGIPRRYAHCRLSKFLTGSERDRRRRLQLQEALDACHRYVDSFIETDGSFRKTGLLFIGPPGGGKTHLAVGVLYELIERYRVRGRFVDLTALVPQVQRTFERSSTASKSEVMEPLLDAEVLVLDELGSHINLTQWMRDFLYLLINGRYLSDLPTIFTTNFRLEAPSRTPSPTDQKLDRGPDPPRHRFEDDLEGYLEDRLSPMLISRLHEMAMPVVLSAANDYREDILSARTRV